MYKQIILVVILSIVVAVAQPYAAEGLGYYLEAHDWLENLLLTYVLANGPVGDFLVSVLSFLVLPLLIGLAVALLYRLIKKTSFAGVMFVVWATWLVLSTALVLR